jgi:hypothetical protein
MKQAKTTKPYWEMTADELTQATCEFDKPLPQERFKAATKADRARFKRALRAGARIARFDELGLDPKLLSTAAAYAKRKNIPLRVLLERALRRALPAKH